MQLDLFADSRDVMLRNDVLDALHRRHARRAWERLVDVYPADDAVPTLATLIAAREDTSMRRFTGLLWSPAARGAEGKWFAAAKDAGLLDLAASLAFRSPTDPRTLTRAARDFVGQAPAFAVTCGSAALHWMSTGYGYEITGNDVLDAYGALADAALATGMTRDELNRRLRDQFAASPGNSFVTAVLAHHVAP
jgi:hypothetical protein